MAAGARTFVSAPVCIENFAVERALVVAPEATSTTDAARSLEFLDESVDVLLAALTDWPPRPTPSRQWPLSPSPQQPEQGPPAGHKEDAEHEDADEERADGKHA